MRFLRVAFVTALGVWCAGAHAQSRDDLVRCRAIEDQSQRLVCYDSIALSPAAPRSKYEPVPFEELQNFALSYRGRFVEVTGWIEPGDRFFLLRGNEQNTRSLPVDLRTLSRSEQESTREQCGTGCEATVQGRVDPVNFTTGINAERIIVQTAQSD
jgi:hypothetical protein